MAHNRIETPKTKCLNKKNSKEKASKYTTVSDYIFFVLNFAFKWL